MALYDKVISKKITPRSIQESILITFNAVQAYDLMQDNFVLDDRCGTDDEPVLNILTITRFPHLLKIG